MTEPEWHVRSGRLADRDLLRVAQRDRGDAIPNRAPVEVRRAGIDLDHRQVVLQRRTKFRLAEIARRLEILEGYIVAYLNLDAVIKIIRTEDDPKPKSADPSAPPNPNAKEDDAVDTRALDAEAETWVATGHVPGILVALIKNGQVAATRSYGSANSLRAG